MDEHDQGRPFVTGQCVRCGMEAVGGICDECLEDLGGWLRSAAQTWRRYPPRHRLAAARATADQLQAAVQDAPPPVQLAMEADSVEVSDL